MPLDSSVPMVQPSPVIAPQPSNTPPDSPLTASRHVGQRAANWRLARAATNAPTTRPTNNKALGVNQVGCGTVAQPAKPSSHPADRESSPAPAPTGVPHCPAWLSRPRAACARWQTCQSAQQPARQPSIASARSTGCATQRAVQARQARHPTRTRKRWRTPAQSHATARQPTGPTSPVAPARHRHTPGGQATRSRAHPPRPGCTRGSRS